MFVSCALAFAAVLASTRSNVESRTLATTRFDEWRDCVLWPTVWWSGADYAITVHVPEGMPDTLVTLMPRDGSRSVRVRSTPLGSCGMERARDGAVFESASANLGRLSPGTHTLVFDVRFARASDPALELGRHELEIHVVVVDDLERVVRAERSARACESVRGSLRFGFASDARATAMLGLIPFVRFGRDPGAPRVHLEVAVIRDGVVIERCDLGERGSVILRSVERGALATGDWRLRISGTPISALHDPGATSWWSGELTISPRELLERSPDRPPEPAGRDR